MWLHIDPSSGTPMYRQIADQIRQAVAGGILRPGDRLPSVRDLAVYLTINPNTVVRAYQELEKDGLIETARGRGVFVSCRAAEVAPDEKVRRIAPILDRLVAEAYLLGIGENELLELVRDKLRERGGLLPYE
ncbi:MAG TPA: GntR family transcriptional regulator [Firmicutes bacterium]|nr:GntR family transcriptional regulator [Candidatus Fermentithermobacillaceae bacterium]